MSDTKYFPIINRDESYKLEIREICYVYRTNRVLRFDTSRGVIRTYEKIDNVEKYLGPEFYRCMAGCIVNLSRIKEMKDLIIYFDTGETLKLKKDPFQRVKQRFNVYMLSLLHGSDDSEDEG